MSPVQHPRSAKVGSYVSARLRLAHKPKHNINVVTAVAEELAAAHLRGIEILRQTVLINSIGAAELLGPYRHLEGCAVLAAVYELLKLHNAGPETNGVCTHKFYICFFGSLYKRKALFLIHTKGLFAGNVLTVFNEEFTSFSRRSSGT